MKIKEFLETIRYDELLGCCEVSIKNETDYIIICDLYNPCLKFTEEHPNIDELGKFIVEAVKEKIERDSGFINFYLSRDDSDWTDSMLTKSKPKRIRGTNGRIYFESKEDEFRTLTVSPNNTNRLGLKRGECIEVELVRKIK